MIRRARKRHIALSGHSSVMPIVASSRTAKSVKIRYPMSSDLPECE